mgnify:CR=1 FL=1
MNRRNFLAKTGMGAGVAVAGGTGLGGVSATDASTAEDPSVVTTVEATGTHGFITASSDTPEGESRLPLLDGSNEPVTVRGTLRISGEVYDDGTWQMTTVSFPRYVPRWSNGASIKLTATEFSKSGTFDPQNGLVTAPMTVQMEFSGDSESETMKPSDGSDSEILDPFDLTLTSGTSGDMTGGLSRPTDSTLTVTLVENEFGRTEVAPVCPEPPTPCSGGLGAPGRNWFELGLEMTVDNPGALEAVDIEPPSVVGDNPPTDPDGDGNFENILGDGEFDAADVQALFDNLDNSAVQDNAANYNFAGGSPEEVTPFDVQALFSKLG